MALSGIQEYITQAEILNESVDEYNMLGMCVRYIHVSHEAIPLLLLFLKKIYAQLILTRNLRVLLFLMLLTHTICKRKHTRRYWINVAKSSRYFYANHKIL